MTKAKQKWYEEPEEAPARSGLACPHCSKIITGKTISAGKCEFCGKSIKLEDVLKK